MLTPMIVVVKPTLGPTEQVVAAITGPLVGLAELETMLKCLLPAVPAQAPPPRSSHMDIEVMLKRLLPGTPTQASQPRPVTASRDWYTALCFSCDNYVHGVGRCPQLYVTFPFMLPGWSAEKVITADDFTTPGGRMTRGWKRQLIHDGRSAARISNKLRPRTPAAV